MRFYINLPVRSLKQAKDFYSALGFGCDDNWSDDTALAMQGNDGVSFMLLTHEKFQTFTPRPIANAHETTGALLALQLPSKEAVDQMVAAALRNGGGAVRDPQDHGFMYGHAFADPDGHVWEPFFMDETAFAPSADKES